MPSSKGEETKESQMKLRKAEEMEGGCLFVSHLH